MTEQRREIAYPFPFDDFVCKLWLPADGLTRDEADRIKEYIESLVTVEAHVAASRAAREEAQREREAMRRIASGEDIVPGAPVGGSPLDDSVAMARATEALQTSASMPADQRAAYIVGVALGERSL